VDGLEHHPDSLAPRPQLLIGPVRHRRLRPLAHQFEYRSCMLVLPMRALRQSHEPALCRNRFGALAFHDRDHGVGGDDALAWLESLLQAEGVRGIDGEIWLQTYPRVLGFVFKPVSFWYCHRADGRLAAVVAEVNNTFGERHCYLLDGDAVAYGRELRSPKVLHVSPFCRVAGSYRFRFMRTAQRLVARVDHDDEEGPLLSTSVSGRLLLLDRRSVWRTLVELPLFTLAVVARIHWQAARLWFRGTPWFTKPPAPASFTSK
jgi:DUF1365 family protein